MSVPFGISLALHSVFIEKKEEETLIINTKTKDEKKVFAVNLIQFRSKERETIEYRLRPAACMEYR